MRLKDTRREYEAQFIRAVERAPDSKTSAIDFYLLVAHEFGAEEWILTFEFSMPRALVVSLSITEQMFYIRKLLNSNIEFFTKSNIVLDITALTDYFKALIKGTYIKNLKVTMSRR